MPQALAVDAPRRAEALALHAMLRAATSSQHAALDAALAFDAEGITRERYAAFLHGLLRVMTVVEPALERWPLAFEHAARIELLRRDLESLGTPPGPVEPVDLAAPRDLAEGFGAAYVVEGSALGGQILAPRIERALDVPRSSVTHYLRLRGERTSAHWKQWLARLAAFDATATPRQRDAACAMARAVFATFSTALVPATRTAA